MNPNFIRLFVLIAFITVISGPVLAANQTQQTTTGEASDAIKKSQNAINYMENLGLNTERVNDLLEDARISFDLRDFDRVVEIGNIIVQFKETAISLTEDIEKIKVLIKVRKYL